MTAALICVAISSATASFTGAPAGASTVAQPGCRANSLCVGTGTMLTFNGPRSVAARTVLRLSGSLQYDMKGLRGRALTVQSRPRGAHAWKTAAHVRTRSGGGWALVTRIRVATSFRAVFGGERGHQRSTSGALTVAIARGGRPGSGTPTTPPYIAPTITAAVTDCRYTRTEEPARDGQPWAAFAARATIVWTLTGGSYDVLSGSTVSPHRHGERYTLSGVSDAAVETFGDWTPTQDDPNAYGPPPAPIGPMDLVSFDPIEVYAPGSATQWRMVERNGLAAASWDGCTPVASLD